MTHSVLRRLRLEWTGVTLLVVGGLLAGWTVLAGSVSVETADRWLLPAGSVLGYELVLLGVKLRANRTEDGAIRATLGIANYITIVRGGLFATVAGFLFVSPTTPVVAWAPGICYGIGVILDYLDGTTARIVGRQTALGEQLDLAFDTLGFLVAPLVGVVWGRLPIWYLSISLARYLYRGGVAWRTRRGRPVGDLPDSRVRRPLAAVQMVFITVALLPVISTRIIYPLAAVVATPSIVVFIRDYLAVTGRHK
ncbi:MAG: CDP-alcohol phosphatidyltransferase family protein [Halobacteriales archaeon]